MTQMGFVSVRFWADCQQRRASGARFRCGRQLAAVYRTGEGKERLVQELEVYLRSDGADSSTLGYIELQRAGRNDLVEGLMEHGGRVAFLSMFGISTAPLDENEVSTPQTKNAVVRAPSVFEPVPDTTLSLAIGGAKAERLSSAAVAEALENAKELDAEKAKRRTDSQRRRERRQLLGSRFFGSPLERPVYVPPEFQLPPGQSLYLNGNERVQMVLLAFLASLAWGRTPQAYLPEQAILAFQALSFFKFVEHGAWATQAARVAQRGVRSVPYWFLRGAIGGRPALGVLQDLNSAGGDSTVLTEAVSENNT